MHIMTINLHFAKNADFDQKYTFWSEMHVLTKIAHFDQKGTFCYKLTFWPKMHILIKIHFFTKNVHLQFPNYNILLKMLISTKN